MGYNNLPRPPQNIKLKNCRLLEQSLTFKCVHLDSRAIPVHKCLCYSTVCPGEGVLDP